MSTSVQVIRTSNRWTKCSSRNLTTFR